MPDAPTSLQLREIMVRLQGEYLVQVRGHLPEFMDLRKKLAAGPLAGAAFDRLYRLSHDFAGSGTTFGFAEVSGTARALHLSMREKDERAGERMNAFVAALEAALAEIPGAAALRLALPEIPATAEEGLSSEIFLMDPPAGLAEEMRNFGYAVVADAGDGALAAAVAGNRLKALVAFTGLSPDSMARLETLRAGAPEAGTPAAPFILCAPAGDFTTRLAAVRLGAQGFFEGEPDALRLIERIEQLSRKFAEPPRYNVMIVDDDRMLTEFYNHTLSRAGMNVTTLTDPREAAAALAEKQVDLLLIDHSMPGCDGRELAAVIRQHERHVGLPIVFISSYEELRQAIVDTGLGIDDFLVKPFTPEALFTVVRRRAQRALELKSYMMRDGFTGLLNHAYFNEALDAELARVRRGGRAACYAMLDLDHFKAINDTYGHAAGDLVIRGVSRALQQQLRRTDTVGRCGGEEFGVILPDCSPEQAVQIIEKIRRAFGGTEHAFGPARLRVTFSAGVAALRPGDDLDTALKSADAALYTAKRRGRDRVCLWGEE